MKKIIIATVIAFIFLSSCQKTCDLGWEGKDCKTESRTKFYGKYQGVITVNGITSNSYINVGTSLSNVTEVLAGSLTATMSDNNGNFYISRQSPFGNRIQYGNMIFEDNTVTQSLTVLDQNGDFYQDIFFTGLKQ